jgi:hypothetical protein
MIEDRCNAAAGVQQLERKMNAIPEFRSIAVSLTARL